MPSFFSNPNSNKHSIFSLHSDTWFAILLNRMKTFIHFKCVMYNFFWGHCKYRIIDIIDIFGCLSGLSLFTENKLLISCSYWSDIKHVSLFSEGFLIRIYTQSICLRTTSKKTCFLDIIYTQYVVTLKRCC